ncbi:MAG: DNA polymerase [Acidobacteria bacterium]|nr:DNA polymerase [Acidobacteriota bacterium]|tara:strand:+ start:674 stop:2941 length:2268 start_codon:yes stop_codon:yes gene_type:complete
MANIALIETKPSAQNYDKYFEFEFDRFALCSDSSVAKVLKRNVDLEIDTDDYDWLILVGAEAFKHFTKKSSVTEYNGKIIDEKYLALINPSMIKFKPEAKKAFDEALESIAGYVSGELKLEKLNEDKCYGIQDKAECLAVLQRAIECPSPYVALDTETSSLYPRDGYMLGFSLSYEPNHGCYVDASIIGHDIEEKMQELFDKKRVVFHNAKFDLQWLEYHFNFRFPNFEDTMLLHYMFDENPGTHGLKQLALKHTPYGDYEKPLQDWGDNYRRTHGVLKADFSYDLIPFDVMYPYAAMDAVVTFLLYQKMSKAIETNSKLNWVYRNILLEGCDFLKQVESNGVPFDRERLEMAQGIMQKDIDAAIERLYEFPEVSQFEKAKGSNFNPNSTLQLRSLLYDYIGLTPTGKKTGTGADSTDAEVLGELGRLHEVPQLILEIRQKNKIKTTYLDKIIPNLDRDSRLRTGFNLHGTTSGRLSSSGKLNMQQLPRDNPTVKGCIKATEGHKIVSMDLTTAEVYVASILSKDEGLQDVFREGGNFHSTIAKQVFRLPCKVEEVDEFYSEKRQQAKAVTFGIMYGAGPSKISWQVTKDSGQTFTVREAGRVIKEYFESFPNLKQWLDDCNAFISVNAFIYSALGRKRRLPNALSKDKGIASHEIRSGINFLVQSVASDINLLGAIDMQHYINKTGMQTKIFGLVHDSILAEVPEDEIDLYSQKLKEYIQKDRGFSIPGCPIGCDFEINDDYSMGKWDNYYAGE